MGEATLHESAHQLIIRAVLHFYGEAASAALALRIADDIATQWNEPRGKIKKGKEWYEVVFEVEGFYTPGLAPETVWYNTHPRNNYFRVESFSTPDISFVDGLNCNTGYFKAANLVQPSTTAAHEFGHTLGLTHPELLDIRGKGRPGMMYPRGTVCDPEFQYDPGAAPLQPGGTMNPAFRKVFQQDIDNLRLHRLSFDHRGVATVGDFSSTFHEKHMENG